MSKIESSVEHEDVFLDTFRVSSTTEKISAACLYIPESQFSGLVAKTLGTVSNHALQKSSKNRRNLDGATDVQKVPEMRPISQIWQF